MKVHRTRHRSSFALPGALLGALLLSLSAGAPALATEMPVPANHAPGGEAHHSLKAVERAERIYQQCLNVAKLAEAAPLSIEEQRAIELFRAKLSRLTAIRGRKSNDPRFDYVTQLGRLLDEVKIDKASPRVVSVITELMFQEKLETVVQQTIGLQSKEWSEFKPLIESIREGGPGHRAGVITKRSVALLQKLGRYFDANSPLNKFGAKTSLADWEARRGEALMAFQAVFEGLMSTRAVNMKTTDYAMKKQAGFVRQLTVGAVGGAGLAVALAYSAPAVGASAAAGEALVGSAVVGETLGVAGVGALGGAASVMIEQSVDSIATAWMESGNKNTPFTCELQKEIELSREGEISHIAKGALTGAVAGSVLSGASRVIPKTVMWIVGGAVVGAELYEVGEAAYAGYEIYNYMAMASEAEDAGDHELALECLTEARYQAKEAALHTVDAIIVGILARALFVEGEFKEALHEGGKKIAEVIAMSSDEIPAAAKSAGSAGQAVLGAGGAEEGAAKTAKLASKLIAAKAKAAKIAAAKAGVVTDIVTSEVKNHLPRKNAQ